MQLLGKKQYKANLHCHTTLSDGHLSPEEVKEAYRAAGYSVLCITDHETPYDHTALSEDGFLMLTGYEAYVRHDPRCIYDTYVSEVHLNFFAKNPHNTDVICFNEAYMKYVKDEAKRNAYRKVGSTRTREYSAEYINEMIQTAKDDGYLVALNHPVWSMESDDFLFSLRGCFSMEMCNYSSFLDGMGEYNGPLYDKFLRRGDRLFVHSADDNHNSHSFDHPASDSFGGFAMIETEDEKLTYDGVISALEQGNFYSSMGPLIHSLTVTGNTVTVKTSPVARISMLFGSKTPIAVFGEKKGDLITEATFTLPDRAEFFRINAVDEGGRYADTRGYFRDEFDFQK